MEVQQAQIGEQVVLPQPLHCGQQFGNGEAEFGLVADGAAPAPCAAAGELGPHTDVGRCSQAFARFDNPVDFVRLFNHHHRLPSKTSRQDRCLDVEPILVAVADQQRLGVVQQRESDQQFRFASCFQTEVPALAAAHQLLHHVALLVALHREDALVPAGVAVLRDGAFKGGVEPLQTVFEDVVEANQQRQRQVAAFQLRHQIHQIQAAAAIPLGLNADVAAPIDGEIRIAPAVEAVQRSTVLNRPVFAV